MAIEPVLAERCARSSQEEELVGNLGGRFAAEETRVGNRKARGQDRRSRRVPPRRIDPSSRLAQRQCRGADKNAELAELANDERLLGMLVVRVADLGPVLLADIARGV